MKSYQLSEKWRLASDSHSFTLERARTRNGKISWDAKLYFSSIDQAAKAYAQIRIRESDEPLPQAILDAITGLERVCDDIHRVTSGEGLVNAIR